MLRSLALLFALAPAGLSQTASTPAPLSLEQKEEFLKTAKVVRTREAAKGITNTRRATLTDGNITHDASIQTIDESRTEYETPMGRIMNFRDSYKFNIAAYRLGRMLGLENMIPPSIQRSFGGNAASWTWWIEDVKIDETQRRSGKVEPPDKEAFNRQTLVMKVFDQLISNFDRNQQNILYDKDWRLWMIDHSRSFQLFTNLPNQKEITGCDRQLFANLKKLDQNTLSTELKGYLEPNRVKSLLARRDRIVAAVEALGPQKLYDWLPAK